METFWKEINLFFSGCSSAWLIQYASEMRSLDHLNDAVCQTPVALTGVRLGEATIADECNVKYVDDAQGMRSLITLTLNWVNHRALKVDLKVFQSSQGLPEHEQ